MDFASSAGRSSDYDAVEGEEDHSASASEDRETNCWGCGLRVSVSAYATVFKCGWCGAITKEHVVKNDNIRLRRWLDRCFVIIVITFMLFFICAGVWAIYPVVFSISYFCGVFHLSIAVILSICTLSSFCLSAFQPAGVPPMIVWGSYPAVGQGGLENYTFCHYCSKPKSPVAHHCRSCGTCVLDMDHHCPFIGNCVGAANHRCFILFLISTVISTLYVAIVTSYSALHIWPPLEHRSLNQLTGFANPEFIFGVLKDNILSFLRSAVFLSARGVVLVYLFIASFSVGTGLSVLLWQQLSYIYVGKTYLSHLSAVDSDEVMERDCQNLVRFFGFPYKTAVYLPSYWKSRKAHKR
ncbi:DHHC-type zinc finger family protein [Perilla frutescens var. hirtella]|uniref:S-acyltransferase n=1 Tax=Perilla frutescens var. hirtella TaxID=608512 RepID=A0AAD4P3W7_PERFH|nr:DHHC-type zinc finger family protein [Perilla frutescens var. hirtella]KAH6825010.1 DHHC-type zinc finger family protein [Perilla frutescens var. hirtella]